jgi:hypothetical protein
VERPVEDAPAEAVPELTLPSEATAVPDPGPVAEESHEEVGGSEADEWTIERDPSETLEAEEPTHAPAWDDLPEAGAELPDWAASGDDDTAPDDLPTETEVPEQPTDEPTEVDHEPEAEPAAAEAELPEPETDASSEVPVTGFTFGRRDPVDKARRLARVLVSDMVMYNSERHQDALSRGTLAEDFEEEIDKSWKEFVDQLGSEFANGEGRPFWTQALNDILAKGEEIF